MDLNADASVTRRPATVVLQQQSEELQQRLMVQQDSKLVQVDLQDLGYETCGRSENEAEREDTSSPGSSERPLVHTPEH